MLGLIKAQPDTNMASTQGVHTLNYILPKLKNIHYMTIIIASSGYHNLQPDKKSPYLTTVACQLGSYSCIRLPFGVAPAGDMF